MNLLNHNPLFSSLINSFDYSPDPTSNVTVHWSSSSWLQPDPAPEYTKSSITPDAGV